MRQRLRCQCPYEADSCCSVTDILYMCVCICVCVCIMQPIATVCLVVTWICPAKTAELIEMPFAGLTQVLRRNRVLDGGEDIGRIHSLP